MAEKLPLVLIPGHLGTALSWRYQCADLGLDRDIVIPEHHASRDSIKDMAVAIAPTLPPAFDLAGWSMGGYIVFELLPLVRDRVRRTLLIHTSARPDTPAASAARREHLRRLQTQSPAEVLREQLTQGLRDSTRIDPDFLDGIIAENLRLGRVTLEWQIDALIGRADSRPALPATPGQFLVIAGRHDTTAPLEAGREIAELLPGARLEVLDDAGHFSLWEQPGKVNALMREFLDG
jgi:pimeloyl-ACP methyl ester carboxylesterase